MTQSREFGEMWSAALTSGLLRYRVDGVEFVHGGSSLADLNMAAKPRNFWANENLDVITHDSVLQIYKPHCRFTSFLILDHS